MDSHKNTRFLWQWGGFLKTSDFYGTLPTKQPTYQPISKCVWALIICLGLLYFIAEWIHLSDEYVLAAFFVLIRHNLVADTTGHRHYPQEAPSLLNHECIF